VCGYGYTIRGMDDIVLRHRDADESEVPEEKTYYLTDDNGNVVMTVDDEAYGIERIFYRAYGDPECFPFGDVDGNHITNALIAPSVTPLASHLE
jgi:hypothetical protein